MENHPHNRSKDTNRSDSISNIQVGLYDIDSAIKYYFEQIIQPTVIVNDELYKVPIIYGSPERWKSTQKDGYFRDKKGQLQIPLIMFRRTNFENNRELGRHLDANNPMVFVSHNTNYTKYNNYDKFSILNNQVPQKQFHNVVIPKYIKLSYECIIWTQLIEQMNKIQETINYADSSYWGEPDKFTFLAVISGFDKSIELSDGEDRTVKSTFNIEINGFIVPETLQKQLKQSSTVSYNMTKIIMKESDNL